MGSQSVSMDRVGAVINLGYNVNVSGKLYITLTVNGGTYALEHIDQSNKTEAGTWIVDTTYNTDQVRTQFAGTKGLMYRLRCTVAPSAGKNAHTRIEQND